MMEGNICKYSYQGGFYGIMYNLLQLWILNDELEMIQIINKFQSLSWKTSWYNVGTFELTLSESYYEKIFTDDKARYLFRNDSDYMGRIDEIILTQGLLTVRGTFLESILSFRYENEHNKSYSGNLETVVRKIVNDNCILSKPIKHLKLGVNLNRGNSVNLTMFGKEVLTTLLSLAEVHDVSYNIRYDKTTQLFYFNMLKGLNRTQEQEINDWCIFSHEYANILEDDYLANTNYANYCTIWGEGESAVVDLRKDNTVELREIVIDAKDLRKEEETPLPTYIQMLKDRGIEKLKEYPQIENINASVKLTDNMPYGLGDLVAYRHGVTRKLFYLQITEIEERYELGNINKLITFGKQRTGIASDINNLKN